ncbi:MAG: translation initiation factor IF-6 [Candidatus Bathyarchaeia archaeon]
MAIYLLSLFGCASIGVYSLATEKMAILPLQTPETKVCKIEDWLGVKVAKTTIGGSLVVGALVCANSNGVILPHSVREEELETIMTASEDANVTVMETRRTAYGNMVLANDHGAIVDPRLNPTTIEKISDTLGVEVVAGEIAGLPYVGSLALATNRGVLAHPMIKEEEQRLLKEVLKAPVDVGSINCGIPYVATGLIGNSSNVVAGFMTTGPEMFIIGQALDVVK